MTAQHTPGPWHLSLWGRNKHAIFGATNALPLAVALADGHHTTKQANARLIAAAPDLLEALTHAVEIAEGKRTGTWDDLLQYRAAIQKANGGTHKEGA